MLLSRSHRWVVAIAKYLKFIGVADSPLVWTVDTNSTITSHYQVVALSSSVGTDHKGQVRNELLRQIAALN